MHAAIINHPEQARFNCLPAGDTLDQFEWFTIAPVRHDESEEATVQCEAGEAEFWTIYGWHKDGADAEACFVADAVHDEFDVQDIVRIATQISIETGKGFMAGDIHYGYHPRRKGGPVAVSDFKEIAEDLTFAIHEANDGDIPDEDQRVDDFDNHPLADLREAFVDYSDYSGSDQLNPYHPETVTH
jgi:hypothetical protein